MIKIAISYRRDDSMDITGRIFDRLTHRYGRDAVFRDIDSIPPGIDFRGHLRESLARIDVLMVVVGPRWMGVDRQGGKRIHSETDFVRTEVEIALNRNIMVVPLLVGGSEMPEAGDLPESIRGFAYRNAVEIDSGRDFDHHMDGLVRAIDRMYEPRATPETGQPIGNVPIQGQPTPVETPTHAAHEPGRASASGSRMPRIAGGIMIVLASIHVWWIAMAASDGGLKMFESAWTLADIAFALGAIAAGLGSILSQAWSRPAGIGLATLMIAGDGLWFAQNFDKDMPQMIVAGTGLSLLLGLIAAFIYVFRWPRAAGV